MYVDQTTPGSAFTNSIYTVCLATPYPPPDHFKLRSWLEAKEIQVPLADLLQRYEAFVYGLMVTLRENLGRIEKDGAP